jgi:flagellar protein FlaI
MIIGGTGAGKTSLLNALTSLLSPNDKIITVEEIAELNPPRQNWVQLVSRKSFRFGTSDNTSISLFDLIKVSLRYRPDYITVGEVRGEEAYVLFQAVATGHGGLCTMHADDIDHAIKRLTSPPMNVSEVYVPLMNLCIYVARVDLPKKKKQSFGRRIRNICEIVEHGDYTTISEWLPSKDRFVSSFENSHLLEKIALIRGTTKKQLLREINARTRALRKMKKLKMDGAEVAQAILNYYEGKPLEAAKKSPNDKKHLKKKTAIDEGKTKDKDMNEKDDIKPKSKAASSKNQKKKKSVKIKD